MTCSQLVHCLFITCSWLVNDLFTSCSKLVHELFMTYSSICSWFFWLDYNLFTTCSWLVHQLVHDLFMTCLWLFHDLFMTCSFFFTTYLCHIHIRVSGFSSKLSNLSGNFFSQSLGQINEACKFSEFSEAVYYSPGAPKGWPRKK